MHSGKHLLNGSIRVENRLKLGAEGEVYRGHDNENKVLRALKVKARGSPFDTKPLREAECLMQLSSEHCVELFHSWVDPWDGNLWLMMEYCNGGDMEDYLASHPSPLGEEKLRDFMTQLLLGVLHIHANCIIHRDIKLSNIFLHDIEKDAFQTPTPTETKTGKADDIRLAASSCEIQECDQQETHQRWIVKIGDFGSGKRLSRAWDCGSRACGTPLYSSPEMTQSRSYTIATDVWSLGVCFYVMMTGKFPFDTDSCNSQAELRNAIVQSLPPHPCEVRGKDSPSDSLWDLGDIVMAMLTKRPDQRPSVDTLLQHRVFRPSLAQLHWTPMAMRWLAFQKGIVIPTPSPNRVPLRREEAVPGSSYQLCSSDAGRPGTALFMVIDTAKEGLAVHARPHQSFPIEFRLFYGDQVYLHPIALQPIVANVPPGDIAKVRPSPSAKPPFLWGKIIHPQRWLGGCVMVRWCGVDRLREIGMLPPHIIQRSVSLSPPTSQGDGCPVALGRRERESSGGGSSSSLEGTGPGPAPVLAGTPKRASAVDVVAEGLSKLAEVAAAAEAQRKAMGWNRQSSPSQMG